MTEPPQPPQQPEEPGRPGDPYYQPPQPWDARLGPSTGYPQPGPGSQPGWYGQPGPGGYGPGGYGPGGYGAPPTPTRSPGVSIQLGARAMSRPEPRFGLSLAAAGMVLAIVGVLVWSVGYLGSGINIDFQSDRPHTSGESRRFLGAGLALVLAAAGYALVIIRRRGPLATAGVIAAAIGIPLALIFLTLDIGGVFSGGFPINIDAVFLVSILAWLITYLFVPGAKGRAFFLGLAALYLASYVEYKTAGDSVLRFAASTTGTNNLPSSTPSMGGIAAVGLIFGLGYYLIAALLDRRGKHGVAVALAVAGFFTTVGGISAGVLTFKQVGTGVVLIILGAVLSWYGASFGRRFTTWVWAAAFVVGVGLIVQKALPHSTTGAGITFIVIGALVVAGAQLVSGALREPPEIADGLAPAVAAGQPWGRGT